LEWRSIKNLNLFAQYFGAIVKYYFEHGNVYYGISQLSEQIEKSCNPLSNLRFAGAVSTAAMKGQVGQQAHNIHHVQSHIIQGEGDGVYSDIGGVSSRVGGALPEDLVCKLVCS
jgi:hypothetical protein